MNVEPVIPTFRPDGTVMCLANVSAADIVFADMAEGLAKIARFNGRHRGPPLSVAQHSVMGADALFAETGDAVLAGYFLLHDGHEYLTGDVTKPMAAAVELAAAVTLVVPAGQQIVADAIAAVKRRIDLAIWQAANLPVLDRMPIYQRQVKDMDERMLRAEGIALFGPRAGAHLPAGDRPAPKLRQALRQWAPMKAEEAFGDRLARYLGLDARPA